MINDDSNGRRVEAKRTIPQSEIGSSDAERGNEIVDCTCSCACAYALGTTPQKLKKPGLECMEGEIVRQRN